MPDLPSGVALGRVTWLALSTRAGLNELMGLTGKVTLTLNTDRLRIGSVATLYVEPSVFEVRNDGKLYAGDSPQCYVVGTDLTGVDGLQYRVDVEMSDGKVRDPFYVTVPGNSVVDLTSVVPVDPADPVFRLSGPKGDAGSDATVTAQAVAAVLPSRLSDVELRAAYASRWRPNTDYTAGFPVLNPSGQIVTALTDFTSGATYIPANWSTPSSGGGGSPPTTDASQLTTGTLPPARVGDASITVGKLAFDPATQAELDAAIGTRVPSTAIGAASGVASLDSGGKVPQSQIPAIALQEFLGAIASQATMLALVGQRGDWCTRTDRGTDFQLIAEPSSALASWRERTYPASPVSTVNGRTGAVTTSADDLTDATTVGKAVVRAADGPAARSAIGAGTSSFSGAYADLTGKPAAQLAGHLVRDEGIDLGQRGAINFIGAGVTATDNPGTGATDVTITGSTAPSPALDEWWHPPATGTTSNSPVVGDLRLERYVLPVGTYDQVGFNVATAGGTGSVAKVVVYDDNAGRPGNLLMETATVDTTSTGAKQLTGLSLTGGRVVHVGVVSQVSSCAFTCNGGTGEPTLSPTFQPTQLRAAISTLSGVTGAAPATASAASRGNNVAPRVGLHRSAT